MLTCCLLFSTFLKNDITYNEDLSERQFLQKLKADEAEVASKAKPKKRKSEKPEPETEAENGEIKEEVEEEIKEEIKEEVIEESFLASIPSTSKPGPKSKKRKIDEVEETKGKSCLFSDFEFEWLLKRTKYF